MKKIYAFVFARGGSKGLPRKNARRLGGVPLIAHSITQAQSVSSVSKVYVSTDDYELAQIAREYGAEVIERPEELASDTCPEIEAWKHAIQYVEATDQSFDVFLSLPATSPLRSVEDIESCIDMLDSQTDSVITITPASRSPYFNMVVPSKDQGWRIMNETGRYSRRQDVPGVFDITTVAYVLRPAAILAGKGIFDGYVNAVLIPKERALDIDDIWDLRFAELIYERINSDN